MSTDTKYYIVRNFYARNERAFNTREQAEAAIKAHALTSKAAHYTELWEMKADESGDGEQIAFFENSQTRMTLA